MSSAASLSLLMRVRRLLDRTVVYLPLVLMGLMAMTTYWLVHVTPAAENLTEEPLRRHEPDYFMREFSVKVFGEDGRLKSEILGTEGRHFPDTDTLEIDQPRIRISGAEGRVTTAVAVRGLINADGSEVQLFDKAVVVREAATNAQGMETPRNEMQSDFLHLFADKEQVRTHLPVVILRGAGDQFTSQDGVSYDNLDQVMQLSGRVRGTMQPPKDKK
ncbi:MAG TPA: LPS export ABC transporter periplasmic protein LptC [Limnohabitans sp.]|jgi:lipopolysaccharide export system protein LptC|uniref:LPS export ABC transporter periplasmic protein LptC n=1 Tax=Limnohabitans sp. TaxID=1907725 RepID=UPI002679A3B9|nr:LPS export ABC transporter periplasmic protein LptC [Limnohabitans sp.]HQR87180.1 LPS export ABC transporter periplasmic protein LptC [Limnohabitans sp.]HQS27772.1 LPS export ABC transporter periplasmic protein LptC [Limnohabitans sp.]